MSNKEGFEDNALIKLANFFRGGTKESMSRLCTFIGYITGSFVAIAGEMMRFNLYEVAALVGVCYGASSYLKFKSAQVERKGKSIEKSGL